MREVLANGADIEGSAAQQQLQRHARNFLMVRRVPRPDGTRGVHLSAPKHTTLGRAATEPPSGGDRCWLTYLVCVCAALVTGSRDDPLAGRPPALLQHGWGGQAQEHRGPRSSAAE